MLAAMLSSRAAAGDEADLLAHRVRGVGGIDLARHPATHGRPISGDLAEDRPADRVMAGAAQADQAQRFAGGDRERHRADILGDDPVDLEHDRAPTAARA